MAVFLNLTNSFFFVILKNKNMGIGEKIKKLEKEVRDLTDCL